MQIIDGTTKIVYGYGEKTGVRSRIIFLNVLNAYNIETHRTVDGGQTWYGATWNPATDEQIEAHRRNAGTYRDGVRS